MSLIFVKRKYILPKDMTSITKKYSFACLLMLKEEKDTIEKIVYSIYKDNI